jgi:ABC-type glycerol-3-phosphate transport system substrate-binding protein
MKTNKVLLILLSLLVGVSMLLSACGGATPTPTEESPEPAETEAPPEESEEPMAEAVVLSLWYHGAGNPEERAVILQIIEDFNASQDEYVVEIEEFSMWSR